MEVTRLEVGDLVWDKCSNILGVVVKGGSYKAEVLWADNYSCWERISEFKIDEDKKIPWIYLMPF